MCGPIISGPVERADRPKLPLIDPGHAVGEDGKRYLFLSGGRYVPLTDDGLSTAGEAKHAYEGWTYPDDWVVESFSQEGPKILKHGEYFHMILAEGGTAGPPTGHMIVSARSRSIHGPWRIPPTTRSRARSRPRSAGGRRGTERSSRARTAAGTSSTTRTRRAS